MPDLDLAVTLTYTAGAHGTLRAEADEVLARTREVSSEIAEAEARARHLTALLDVGAVESVMPIPRAVPEPLRARTWEEILADANDSLGDHDLSIDDLLEDKDKERIEGRFASDFTVATRLDRYDIIAAVAAGVTGALLDYFVTAVPANSGLTGAMRSLSMDADNWLSGIAKVPYDRVAYVDLEGFNPHTHRVQTFGHDPLLGWVYGTMDILRGSLTGISESGVVKTLPIGVPTAETVPAALALQAMHLISDVVTPAGLQLPGWSALLTVDQTLPGASHTIGELSRWMYVRGYDTWHLPSLAAPLLGIEAVLRGYIALRQLTDLDYRDDLDIDRVRSGSDRVAAIPRFAVMSLIAQGIAAGGNAGRFALAGANPLALNYVLWLRFAHSLLTQLQKPTSVEATTNRAARDRLTLDIGWARIPIEPPRLDTIEPQDRMRP